MSKSRGKRINGAGHRHTESPTLGGLLTTNCKWKNVNGVLSGASVIEVPQYLGQGIGTRNAQAMVTQF